MIKKNLRQWTQWQTMVCIFSLNGYLLLLLFWHRKLPKFHSNHTSHTHLYLFEKQWMFCGSQKCTLFIRKLNFPMEKLKVQIKLFVKINLNKGNAVFAGWTNTELCSTAYITRRALYSRSIVLIMCVIVRFGYIHAIHVCDCTAEKRAIQSQIPMQHTHAPSHINIPVGEKS